MESGEKVCDSDNLIGKFEAIDTVMKWHNPIALVRHYSFINFHEYGYQWRPDWFSMVREPVEKVISWFFYVRAPWRVEERIKNEKGYEKPSEEFLNKNFETCFKNGDPECTYEQFSDVEDDPGDHRSQIVQFCGHDPVCRRFNDPIALKMAKENVEKYYKVVGVTEHFNMTLKVLEHFMPEYFKGAFLKYHEDKGVQSFQFKNPNKAKVSEEIKNEMRKYFKYEIEFYDFLKQRLLSQYEQIPEDQKLVEN